MSASAALTITGGFLQLAGLVVAGIGVFRTRKKYPTLKRGVWGTMVDLATGAWRSVTGRSRPIEVVAYPSTANVSATAFPPSAMTGPPAAHAPIYDHLRYVEGELGRLQGEVIRVKERAAADGEDWRAEASRLDEAVEGNAIALRTKLDSAMTDNLAGETLGLWITGFGAVLGIIGAWIGA